MTTSLFSRALGIMVYFREIIPFDGPTIQVSECLTFSLVNTTVGKWMEQLRLEQEEQTC